MKPFNLSDDFGNLAPSATAAKAEESLASLYDEAMDIKNGYGKIGEKLGNELVRLREEIAQGAANAPAGEQGWWNDLLADLSETKTPGLRTTTRSLLKGHGYSDSLASFTATTKAYDEFVGFVRKKYDEYEGKMRELGIDMGTIENPFVAYSHRSATKQYAKDASMIDASRSGNWQNEAVVVNAVAKQLAGLRRDKIKAQQWVESLDQDTLDALKTERVPAKTTTAYPLYEAAKKAGVNWNDALICTVQACC